MSRSSTPTRGRPPPVTSDGSEDSASARLTVTSKRDQRKSLERLGAVSRVAQGSKLLKRTCYAALPYSALPTGDDHDLLDARQLALLR